MIRNMFGGTKCRTIDKVDIFGDSSGVALYQLDGNANDTGGNYHGTEVANVSYGGGVYERGVIVNLGKIDLGTGSKVLMPHNSSYSISAWIYNTGTAIRRVIAGRMNTSVGTGYGDWFVYEYDNTIKFNKIYAGVGGAVESLIYTPSFSVGWHHIVLSFNRGSNIANIYTDGVLRATKSNWNTGTYDNNLNTLIGANHNENVSAYQDQLRFFNRAITATEVATLYAECAPTSTVDNINPFMDGSLKALYQFDGDATDATGVYNGTATNVTYGTGKFGQCAVFNGTNAGVKLPQELYSGTQYSLSIWCDIYNNSTSNSNDELIFSKRNGIMTGLLFTTTTGAIGWNDWSTTAPLITSPIVATLGWTHIVITQLGAIVKMYCNGIYIGQYTSGNFTQSIANGNNIGAFDNAGSKFFTGSIDQFRIFNKALTPLEVASLYNETTPLEEPMYKLVDPFRDGSGKALYRLEGNALDESGNYNGTATNVTYGAGQFGRSGVFKGTNAGVKLPQEIYTGTEYSVSIWCKTVTVSTSNTADELIFSKRNGVMTGLLGITTTGAIGFNDWSSVVFNIVGPVATTGAWTNVIITQSGTTVKMYVNGTYIGQCISGNYTQVITNGNNIGAFDNAGSKFFTGSIDQVRIFNRALTATEIIKLYTGENNVL